MRRFVSVQISSALFMELANYLQSFGDERDVSDIVETAIESWLQAAKGEAPPRDTPLHGYQWKNLFLPEGTELKMEYRGTYQFATVVGNVVMYRSEATTPNRFAAEVAGTARNAWRSLWLKLPGQRYWKNASFIRAEQQRAALPDPQPSFQPHSPSTAPAVMAQSLRNALALIEKASTSRHGMMERRTDILPDD